MIHGFFSKNFNFKETLVKPFILVFIFSFIFNFFPAKQAFAIEGVSQFHTGVSVTTFDGYFNVKVNRDLLPGKMKNFTLISVCGVDNISDNMIKHVIDDTIEFGYGLQTYNEVKGFNEMNDSTYNLVMLFDANRVPLGYYILNKSKVTIDTIKDLLLQFYNEGSIKNKGIYNSLYTKLSKENFDPLINELNAQSGKGIDETAVRTLLENIKMLSM